MSGADVSPVLVREAVLADADALARCHLACWREAYAGLVGPALLARLTDADAVVQRAERWRSILGDQPGGRLVADDGSTVVGFAAVGATRDDEPGLPPVELYSLYVRAAHWSTGLGHRLLVAALGGVDATLWVFRDNARARGFYERHGFEPDGTEKEEPVFRRPEVRLVRRSAA